MRLRRQGGCSEEISLHNPPRPGSRQRRPNYAQSAPKRDLPTAADLRQHAADLRSSVALMEAAMVVERELDEDKAALTDIPR